MNAYEYENIAELAYRLWEERGRPEGSPEVDWYQAERELESRRHAMPLLLSIALEPGWSGLLFRKLGIKEL